jgi:hypothetical protein
MIFRKQFFRLQQSPLFLRQVAGPRIRPVEPMGAAGQKYTWAELFLITSWTFEAGAGWVDLPEWFPSDSTCFRCFSRWTREGSLRQILETLARHLKVDG